MTMSATTTTKTTNALFFFFALTTTTARSNRTKTTIAKGFSSSSSSFRTRDEKRIFRAADAADAAIAARCSSSSSSSSSSSFSSSSSAENNTSENTTKKKKKAPLSFHPLSFSGAKLCANMSMLSYWNCGQKGFLDKNINNDNDNENTENTNNTNAFFDVGRFGFEFVITDDPERLRQTALSLCVVEEKERERRTWLDYDATGGEGGEDVEDGKQQPESRTLIVSLKEPNWILVVFRGTTPNPTRGFFRESKINGKAGQVVWKDCPDESKRVKVHAGYANAYGIVRERVERDVLERVKRKIKEEEEGEEGKSMSSSSLSPPRVVITGHSLGGAMATLCAARLGNNAELKKLGAKVSLVTFGQPRVGDSNFKALFDKKREEKDDDATAIGSNTNNNNCIDGYLRVVNEQDVFARVPPKSGIWIPEDVLETSLSSNIDANQWTFQYEHAGDCVWYRDDGRILFREEPKGVSLRTVNPVSIALDHSKYAKLFDDERTKKNFPRAVCFHPERTDPKTICVNCPDPKNDFRRRQSGDSSSSS